MATSDSTAIPDPTPQPRADGPSTFGPATFSPAQLVYWSLRRELWENRFIYIVPLIVAAVFLAAFTIGAFRVPLMRPPGSPPFPAERLLGGGLDFASLVLMAAYVIVAAIYCLGALHNERQERSILFWKSLPVSDVTVVLAKASIPIILLPLITFAILAVTQGLMLLAGGVVLLGRGASLAGLWSQISLLSLWAAVLYHLLTVHALYYAPIYGWFMLVSGWARRAVFLWAILPIVAILIIEKLVFSTSAFAHMLASRLAGGPGALPFPPAGHMPMEPPTFTNIAAFLTTPGLWIGLAAFAVFLAAAARLRRYQGPI
jgi:ABC-2 type transport system permease protein